MVTSVRGVSLAWSQLHVARRPIVRRRPLPGERVWFPPAIRNHTSLYNRYRARYHRARHSQGSQVCWAPPLSGPPFITECRGAVVPLVVAYGSTSQGLRPTVVRRRYLASKEGAAELVNDDARTTQLLLAAPAAGFCCQPRRRRGLLCRNLRYCGSIVRWSFSHLTESRGGTNPFQSVETVQWLAARLRLGWLGIKRDDLEQGSGQRIGSKRKTAGDMSTDPMFRQMGQRSPQTRPRSW